ncbi:hypothetical protein J5N97_022425 [Dioscorea zingiberensis]|uniref:DNA ligase 1 n=1 Tax=Dioscorea zingiberensis TaxID=325984 RepID=A0A9D5CB66_9LILI|nr:hypothetical protein J5N97_022425 [Dioscorea zingiberensis]
MSSSVLKGSAKRRVKDPETLKSEKKRREDDEGFNPVPDLDLDLDLSSDIKGIISALQQIREKAQKDDRKKNEETIGSVALDIRSMLDDAKSRIEKERHTFLKSLLKSSKECENSLKRELAKFQGDHEKFCKEKAAHLQTLKEIFSKYEDEKENLFARYEQQRKKEKSTLSELDKKCAQKIASAEESLKKKKQDDKSFSILRKTLGSFLDNGSDDDDLTIDE